MKPLAFLVVGLLVAPLAATRPAIAESASEAVGSEAPQAHRHFSLGVKLYAEGNFDSALAQFQRAYALTPHFRVLYNMAQCHFELRDYVEARAVLRRYLAEGGAASLDPERRAQVEADLADLSRRIAKLEIHSNAHGAVVYIDGRKVGTTPLTHAVEASEGQRSVTIEASGRGTKQRSILLVGGEEQSMTVNFELLAPEARPGSSLREPRVRSALPSPTSSLGAGFWVAGIGAAVLAGGAGVTGYFALRAEDERRTALDRPGASAVELDAGARRIRTFAMTTDALLGGALVCAGVAITLLVVHGTESGPALAVGPRHVALSGSF